MSVVDKITGTQSGDFTVGITGPNPRKLVATATGLAVQDAAGNPVSLEASNSGRVDRQLTNMPVAPNDTVEFRGWVAFGCTLTQARVYNTTTNTQGTYTLTLTNNATGQTMLNAANFNMNTLSADTVTALTLTATSANLAFSTDDRWTLSLASDNAGLDASGVYVSLLFEAI